MKFITHNKVRMHDTDMAGILYFAKQFRFAHDSLEDLLAMEGFSFPKIFNELHFIFVVVHCEANYFHPLYIGNELEVHVHIEKIGKASFTTCYHYYNEEKILVGNSKTVHCTLDSQTREKIMIPKEFADFLDKYRHEPD